MITRTELSICQSCGEDRDKLTEMLNTPKEWVSYPDSSTHTFLGKSNSQVRAETIINKCSECQDYFYRSKDVFP